MIESDFIPTGLARYKRTARIEQATKVSGPSIRTVNIRHKYHSIEAQKHEKIFFSFFILISRNIKNLNNRKSILQNISPISLEEKLMTRKRTKGFTFSPEIDQRIQRLGGDRRPSIQRNGSRALCR